MSEPAPGGTSGPEGPAKPAPPAKAGRPAWVEWIAILAAAVLVAVVLHFTVVQAFSIPSGSMEPTLKIGDRVLVNKLSYDFHSVHRGDIVVFDKPPGVSLAGVNVLIKRVIGLPGERISSAPDGSVLINGTAIKQPWLARSALANPGIPIRTQVIPRGDYFMMGDNRGNSEDSRFIGVIPGKYFIGRAFFRIWPLSSLGFL